MAGSHQLELELLAGEIRLRAGLGSDDNAHATVIAVRLLGEAGIALDPELKGAAYLRRRVDGGYQIVLRPTIPDVRFAIVHELGHYALREIRRVPMDAQAEERAANYLAAAILAPPEALRRAYEFFGSDLQQLRPLARTFGLSQTAVQLRLAEVLGDERAIVTSRNDNVLTRGTSWAAVPTLEVARGRRRQRDVVKATLRGGIDDGRVALRVR